MTDTPASPVDPAWWRDVVAVTRPETSVTFLSTRFSAAARSTEDLDAKSVLELLSLATSAMLDPSDWNEPYKPVAEFQGRRSPIPSDLAPDQLARLAQIANAMDEADLPGLRGRVNDICWTYAGRNVDALIKAIDAYRSVPLEPDAWFEDGRSEWKRGLELVIRRGASGTDERHEMANALRQRFDTVTQREGFFGVDISSTIREYKLVDRADADEMAEACEIRAKEAAALGNPRLERKWQEEATAWFVLAGRTVDAYAAQAGIARSLATEAQAMRSAETDERMRTAHLVEQALKTLSALPKTYREEQGLEALISDLRSLLQDDRKHLLQSMITVESDPIDISKIVQAARDSVAGLGPAEALVALGSVHGTMSYDAAIQQAESAMAAHPILGLVGHETFTSTGQKVASRPGNGNQSGSGTTVPLVDPAVWSFAVRNQAGIFNLVVSARILPALEVITNQHRYSIDLLYDLCHENGLIPQGRELTWAQGLMHGLNKDFASAGCVLVPQLEHFVRTQLKMKGVHTLFTDENGLETEKGLTPLLQDPKTADIFGIDLAFELKVLLTEHEGPNLRNTIAHGLASDRALLGEDCIYAWWIALQFATLPFRSQGLESQHAVQDPS